MDIIFLGTGAAEGVPAAYCRCSDCEGVRKRGGNEIRTRSSLRLGPSCQIDLSPDLYWQMLRHGVDMHEVEHVLITHTHSDHFSLSGLTDKTMARVTNEKPVHLYLSRPASAYLERLVELKEPSLGERKRLSELFTITRLEYFGEYRAGDLVVETIKANHTVRGEDEYAVNYLITMPDARKLLYALDTGYYREETWEYLRGRRIDLLVMDCTFAGRTDRGPFADGHLAIDSFHSMLERMANIGFVNSRTKIVASHFNPHQGLTHDGIQQAFDAGPFDVVVAHDGMRLE